MIRVVVFGEDYAHEPLRLSVCIEAPREAMTNVLRNHAGVRDLFDNKWLHLFTLDEGGRMAWRYRGAFTWEPAVQDSRDVDLASVTTAEAEAYVPSL